MRIVCPACQAVYEVPDTVLAGKARQVRCARCGAEWRPDLAQRMSGAATKPAPEGHAEPPGASVAAPEPAAEPAQAPRAPLTADAKLASYRPRNLPRADEERPPPMRDEFARPRHVALIGWALSFLVLAALGWAAFTYRGAIMEAWPPSARVYVALGLR